MSAGVETLKEIFHSARELPTEKQNAFLEQACGADHELRREVDALLESDRQADGFIADPPAQLAAELFGQTDIGRTIGQYRLLESVGSGGMGTVYLAERADQQFKMQVAIKLIKRGMDTDQVLRRFQHERQILASLEHPNIARLLDGGTTDDGLPYFVMEYIKGERIDHYAEQQRLSITARLELFRQVCGAVSYAHQHLVVHRDLKPSNILVTPEGIPKLLDFGIAKIIQAGDEAEVLATMTAMPAMTPEYASPEQIDGAHATTLSDVYSLGAVLYELLSGQPPYRLQNRSAQEITRAITTTQIEKPSAVVHHVDDARRLRGDLDNIVLMAMRKETARRYRSVEQFSEDIRRHLAGRPVIARPDTWSYRTGKFWQRNRLALSAAVLLALALVGGIIATSWQAQRASVQEQRARAAQARAERRFNQVRSLAHAVLFDYHDAIKDLPGATKVRERLVKDALSYLDSLAGEAQGDPTLQRELAAAYEKVGDVRGGEASGSLGDAVGAVENYTKALKICEGLIAANRGDAQARLALASNHQKIGILLLKTDKPADGVEHLRIARTLCLDLTREQPANDDFQLGLANAYSHLGRALGSHQHDYPGALAQVRSALSIYEKLVAKNPRDQSYRRGLWSVQGRVGHALWMLDDAAGAIEANTKARALGEALQAEDPLNTDYRRGLVLNYHDGGQYLVNSDKPGAIENFRNAAALDEELLAADPGNALTWKDLGDTHSMIAESLADLEDNSQALLHYGKALECYEKVVTDTPGDLFSRFMVVTCHAGVSRMQARLGEIGSALEEARKAVALLQDMSGGKAGHLGRAQACNYLGYAYLALAASPNTSPAETAQRTRAARDMFQQALNILDDARRRSGSLGANEEWAKDIAAEIAKCDTALGK